MKTLLLALFSFLTFAQAHAADEVNPYGVVFVGDELTVEMATYVATNKDGLHDVLLRIKGAAASDAGIDGKVLRYAAAHGGNGIDFQFQKDGETHNRMASRSPWGEWSEFEVYFGTKTFHVAKDKKSTKELKTKDLLAEYKKSSK